MEKLSNIRRRFFAAVIVGGLVLSSISFGYSGGSGTPEDPYRIATKADLLELAGTTADYNKCFIQTADINMGGQVFTTAIIAADISSTSGFQGTAFKRIYDGNDHKITNFTINGGSNDYLGLFGLIYSSGSVKNLGLEDCTVISSSDSYFIGGLAGLNEGRISDCYTTGSIEGYQAVGGLVGLNEYTISNCYATGNVSGGEYYVGGLVGVNYEGTISNCYATGNISGEYNYVGGLVGTNDYGAINNSYSMGAVSGTFNIGGMAGRSSGSINNCYSTGLVSGSSNVGGLVGRKDSGSISGCYFLITSGPDNGYGEPLTNEQMKQQGNFVGWDFTSIWAICEGMNYPRLRWQILPGDFVCPEGVEMNDLAVLCEEWLLREIPADVWPEGGDGIVNFFDWAVFANQWQITDGFEALADFAEQWLETGINYYIADIAPAGGGDGIVNMPDFAVFAQHWLQQD